MKDNRTQHQLGFKAKVTLAAIGEQRAVPELAKRFGVPPVQMHEWKRQLLENTSLAFDLTIS